MGPALHRAVANQAPAEATPHPPLSLLDTVIPQQVGHGSAAMSCLQCFKRFKLMFQLFCLDVLKVDLECCICYNVNIHMLQAYVSNVLDVCFKCFI
jgi:hypothetical protein